MRELEFDDHIVLNDGRKLRVVEIDDEACYAEEIDEKFSERYLIHFEQIEKIVEKYGQFVVSVKDGCGNDLYYFNVNMITETISVEYKNYQGGYTTNSIKMNYEDFQHIKYMLKYKHMIKCSENCNHSFSTPPNRYKFDIIESDGDLYLGCGGSIHGVSEFVEEMIYWVMERATFDNKEFQFF